MNILRPAAFAICLLCTLISAYRAEAQMIAGKVVSESGAPLQGVQVYGTKWKCCPVTVKSTVTKADGSFRLVDAGRVVHFRSSRLQPTSFILTNSRPVKVSLTSRELSSWRIGRCGSDARTLFGWKFLFRPLQGKPLLKGRDIDYERFGLKGADGAILESWFGPTAASVDAAENYYLDSKFIAERFVELTGFGIVGIDARGASKNGKHWRWVGLTYGAEDDGTSFLGAQTLWPRLGATDMISYKNATAAEAREFDSVIDSVCLKTKEAERKPYPYTPKELQEK